MLLQRGLVDLLKVRSRARGGIIIYDAVLDRYIVVSARLSDLEIRIWMLATAVERVDDIRVDVDSRPMMRVDEVARQLRAVLSEAAYLLCSLRLKPTFSNT